jgi:Flp pilus assembly protein TadD
MIALSDRPATNRSRISRVYGVLIAAATLGVYANSCTGPFIIDDLPGIVGNPDIRHFGGWYSTIAVNLNSAISGRPLMWLTLALNYAAGELNVWGYHALNVVLHLGSSLLVFGVVRRTLLLERWGMLFDAGLAAGLASAITLVWAVHPLLTESVVYVSSRPELLAGFFCLLTLYSSIRAWGAACPRGWIVGAILACAMGLLAKEQAATAPVIVAAYDYVFISGSVAKSFKKNAGLYLGLLSTWTIFVILISFGPRAGTVGFGLEISSLDYLRTQAGVLTHYLYLCFWPHPLRISYWDWPIVGSWLESAPPGVFILALLALTCWGLWRRSWAGFAGAWCFVLLGPTSSIVPITTEIAAERRMYLPLAAVVSLVIGGVYALGVSTRSFTSAARRRVRLAGRLLFAAVWITLGTRTLQRNSLFASSTGVLRETLSARPTDELARGALMETLAREGHVDEARSLFVEGLRLKPNSASMYYTWGEIMAMVGETGDAIAMFREIIARDPGHHRAHRRLGVLLMQRGDAMEAVEHLSRGVQEGAEYYASYNNLGVALAAVGRTDDAVAAFRTAIRLRAYPKNSPDA